MHVIDAEFRRIDEVSLLEALNSIGCYVLWKSKSRVRPAYIGEGRVNQRLLSHAGDIDGGFVAIFDKGSDVFNKWEAVAVEALLLAVAEEADRFPTRNKRRGNNRRLAAVFRHHDTLRVRVSGFDPLLDPSRPRMRGGKLITLKKPNSTNGEWEFQHDWNVRPS